MPVYIVAHEVNDRAARKDLESELRNGFSGSCQIGKSVWLLETIIDSPGIKDRLLRCITNHDRLIVSRLGAQVGAQTLADDGISWLDSKGIRVL